jgi:uncharacterized protein
MEKKMFTLLAVMLVALGLTSCSSASLSSLKPSTATPNPHTSTKSTSKTITTLWDGQAAQVWDKLQPLSTAKLADMQSKTQDPVKQAWIQLAMVTKQKNVRAPMFATELMAWRARHPSHPALSLLPDNHTLSQLQSTSPPRQIALLLPQSGPYGAWGQMVREGFLNAYYANQTTADKQRIKFYDTAETYNITALYQQALADGADVVIGPLDKENVQQLSRSASLPAPILALNYTDTSSRPSNFFEFGLLPEDEAGQLAYRAREAGHTKAIVIAPQNAWGKRLVTAFSDRWQANGGSIQASWYYADKTHFNEDIAHLLKVDPAADKRLMQEDNRKATLEQQRRQDIDVIVLFSQPQEARLIVPLLRFYYASNIPVYTTSSAYSGKPDPEKDVDLNGIIICDTPWSVNIARGKTEAGVLPNRLYAVGQDAYMLSQSLARLVTLPHFPLYGNTGALRLSAQQIHRRLPCVAIRNGRL